MMNKTFFFLLLVPNRGEHGRKGCHSVIYLGRWYINSIFIFSALPPLCSLIAAGTEEEARATLRPGNTPEPARQHYIILACLII